MRNVCVCAQEKPPKKLRLEILAPATHGESGGPQTMGGRSDKFHPNAHDESLVIHHDMGQSSGLRQQILDIVLEKHKSLKLKYDAAQFELATTHDSVFYRKGGSKGRLALATSPRGLVTPAKAAPHVKGAVLLKVAVGLCKAGELPGSLGSDLSAGCTSDSGALALAPAPVKPKAAGTSPKERRGKSYEKLAQSGKAGTVGAMMHHVAGYIFSHSSFPFEMSSEANRQKFVANAAHVLLTKLEARANYTEIEEHIAAAGDPGKEMPGRPDGAPAALTLKEAKEHAQGSDSFFSSDQGQQLLCNMFFEEGSSLQRRGGFGSAEMAAVASASTKNQFKSPMSIIRSKTGITAHRHCAATMPPLTMHQHVTIWHRCWRRPSAERDGYFRGRLQGRAADHGGRNGSCRRKQGRSSQNSVWHGSVGVSG